MIRQYLLIHVALQVSYRGVTQTQLFLKLPQIAFEIRNNDGRNPESDAIASFEINTCEFIVQLSSDNFMKVRQEYAFRVTTFCKNVIIAGGFHPVALFE